MIDYETRKVFYYPNLEYHVYNFLLKKLKNREFIYYYELKEWFRKELLRLKSKNRRKFTYKLQLDFLLLIVLGNLERKNLIEISM